MTSPPSRHTAWPELLAPAGNMEKFQTALLYGANAVYLGGQDHNLRAGCEGFSATELRQAVTEAHASGVFVYYCMNSLPMQSDLHSVPAALEDAASAGVDAFIIADPGIFRMARTHAPQIPIHISTQMNSTNSEALAFWQDLGATRVNLARELPAEDIATIRATLPGMETETFVHGAMCLAVSGQCLMSAWLNNRPANLGRCTHPCRFEYRAMAFDTGDNEVTCSGLPCGTSETYTATDPALTVADITRPDQALWHIHQGGMDDTAEQYSSIWAPQDLCLFPYLPWFIQQGVTALKIEGRMKGPGYVAHVVDAYSSALAFLRRPWLATAAQQNGQSGHLGQHPKQMAEQMAGRPLPKGFAPFMPEKTSAMLEAVCAGFDWQQRMPELLHTASRPLGTGFFLSGQRRNLTQEMADLAADACRAGSTSTGVCAANLPDFGEAGSFLHGQPKVQHGTLPGAPFTMFSNTQQKMQTGQAYAPHELLGKLLEQDGQSWKVAVRGTWHTAEPLEIMIPGLNRPKIIPAAVENHRGDRAEVVHPGTVVTLHLHPKDAEKLARPGFIDGAAHGQVYDSAHKQAYEHKTSQPASGLRPGIFLRSL